MGCWRGFSLPFLSNSFGPRFASDRIPEEGVLLVRATGSRKRGVFRLERFLFRSMLSATDLRSITGATFSMKENRCDSLFVSVSAFSSLEESEEILEVRTAPSSGGLEWIGLLHPRFEPRLRNTTPRSLEVAVFVGFN